MTFSPRLVAALLLLLITSSGAFAQSTSRVTHWWSTNHPKTVVKPAGKSEAILKSTAPKEAPGSVRPNAVALVVPGLSKLPLPGLAPSKLAPNLCLLTYKIGTTSEGCQAFFDQGLGYYYSYVWLESVRSFETAVQHDPECAMAWWGLYRARAPRQTALGDESSLASQRPQGQGELSRAAADLGEYAGIGPGPRRGRLGARKKAAIATIDNLLAVHDEDEEGWYYRAQLAGGQNLFGGQVAAVPFYKALIQINPLHPGANHELLHFYENYKRPALGWVNAENYIKSSPGIPHPYHMQAHLATRIGRWNKTADRSAYAIELERAYHKEMGVTAREDQQYSHHLEILLVSLAHDGRFAEGKAIEAEGKAAGYSPWQPWFRLHLAARDWDGALKIADHYRKSDKNMASYLSALVYLKKGDSARALPEIEVLQQGLSARKQDKQMEYRLWEAQGLYMCQTGAAEKGLVLLEKAVTRSKDDYGHHAWGNGAYYMELWGLAALQSGHDEVAEEAYLEALAHDPGSVRAALGLQVLCERKGRQQEAQRYAELAKKCWVKADSGCLEKELEAIRGDNANLRTTAAKAAEPGPGR